MNARIRLAAGLCGWLAACGSGPEDAARPAEPASVEATAETHADAEPNTVRIEAGSTILVGEQVLSVSPAIWNEPVPPESVHVPSSTEYSTRMMVAPPFEVGDPHAVTRRLADGNGRPGDVELCESIALGIAGNTICALGDAAAWPVQGLIRHFRGEIERRIDEYTAMSDPEGAVRPIAAE